LRLFIAIDIGEEVKRDIASLIDKLRTHDTNIKWVKPENIHITIKFLGEVSSDIVINIEKAISLVASRHSFFVLHARGTGVFPNFARPRVLWVGINKDSGLEKIHNDINNELKPLGFEPEDRDFHPHLTIGRVKSPVGLNPLLKDLRGYMDREFGKITVDKLLLVKSTLKPAGAEYEILYSAPLRKEDL